MVPREVAWFVLLSMVLVLSKAGCSVAAILDRLLVSS